MVVLEPDDCLVQLGLGHALVERKVILPGLVVDALFVFLHLQQVVLNCFNWHLFGSLLAHEPLVRAMLSRIHFDFIRKGIVYFGTDFIVSFRGVERISMGLGCVGQQSGHDFVVAEVAGRRLVVVGTVFFDGLHALVQVPFVELRIQNLADSFVSRIDFVVEQVLNVGGAWASVPELVFVAAVVALVRLGHVMRFHCVLQLLPYLVLPVHCCHLRTFIGLSLFKVLRRRPDLIIAGLILGSNGLYLFESKQFFL